MATIVRGKNAKKPYTVRYYYDGKQRERSFTTRKDAQDWLVKFEHDSREQTFVDPKIAGEKFGVVAQRWLAKHTGSANTLKSYDQALRLHVLPVFGDKSLAAVAADRASVETFLRYVLPAKGLGPSAIRTCYIAIVAIVRDAVKAGRLGQNANRLSGISLPEAPRRAEIPFAKHVQIEMLAGNMGLHGYGLTIWLMRGCGLRLGEALGVQAGDFRDAERTLRLTRQTTPDGRAHAPLKHRNEGDYRDIPVPYYVLKDHAAGFTAFEPINHRTYRHYFTKAREYAGLPSTFTPHTLRHIYASVCLAGGIPITDVSKWLGHRDINITYGIYGHLVPASWERARGVLDEEWES